MRHRIAAVHRRVCGGILMFLPRRIWLTWLVAVLVFPLSGHARECAGKSGEIEAEALLQVQAPAESLESAGPEAPQRPLAVLFQGNNPKHAVVLLAGIYNDHRYFRPWWECFTGEEALLLGWQRPHQAQRLDVSARLLAAELVNLQELGVRQVTLLAHSIGGLVAKGAVDWLSREQLAGRFDYVDLHAFGTPWGGFPGADLAHANPLGYLVSYLAGHPAWLDLGTHSAYLAGLAQPMPPNGRLFNYIGEQDEVAWPSTEEATQRYADLLRHVSASVRLSGPDHNAYVRHSIQRLMQFAQQRSSPQQMANGITELSSGASD